MTRYFITGGSGFIGSHLVDRLMADGNEITAYDNLVSGKEKHIEHHLGKQNLRFIEADLLDSDNLKQAMKGNEVVWHLGANTDIPGGNRITDLDLNNCTIATRNVLEAMREPLLKPMALSCPLTSMVPGNLLARGLSVLTAIFLAFKPGCFVLLM